jgi:hypothetical protein
MSDYEIPDFLIIDASKNMGDRKRLLMDLQLYCLWREVNGDKPFDIDAAIKLQEKQKEKYNAHLRKLAEKALKNRKQAEKSLRCVVSFVATRVLDVEISFYAEEVSASDPLGWDDKIKDEVTGETLGTPRELLRDDGVTFVECGDPRQNLKDFIANLKSRYAGFERQYSFARFDRHRYFPRQRNPFEKKPARFAKFTIMLKWSPFSDKEILRRAKKWVKPYV